MLDIWRKKESVANQEELFERIASDIESQGYSINPCALDPVLANQLYLYIGEMDDSRFNAAGIGRGEGFTQSRFVRKDEICWITGESATGRHWLNWADALKEYLNRRLFLGLFSFESHYAHYSPGDFYKRHLDAFQGQTNRILSLVVYLNPGWVSQGGGELVLYKNQDDQEGIKVTPLMGTVVAFLSEEFPHEVLAANHDRYSIAGWFRVNTSTANKVDPALANEITNILMNDERYNLHDWNRNNIYPKAKDESIAQLTSDTILRLRCFLISKKIDELLEETKGNTQNQHKAILEDVMSYKKLDNLLSRKLKKPL